VKPGGPRVLVIDDDPRVKEALSSMIEREGWSFYGADNVEEAVAAVNDIQPEVIVLEPRADHGRAVTMLIDVHQAGVWIPVILYTSDSTIDDAWALEHGASGLMRKPLGEALLRERIGELLNGRETDRPL
jgi:DNA-binding NtrC family response regulator